jgi:thiosulfate/3-mercaptopyruvate sulfurtransferase
MLLDPVIAPHELASLPDLVLLDCRPDERAYLAGHVRGAFHAQLERDLSSPAPEPAHGGRHPLPNVTAFAATLARWGIRKDSQVVVYDEQSGANAAARCWWLLRALGHTRVQVLDGGFAALVAEGYELTTEVPVAGTVPVYPASAFTWPLADIDEVERARNDPARRVVDVRAAFRYRGESEPIDPVAGHIPGALNVPLSDNLRADGSFKDGAALRELYAPILGATSATQAIVHCGSGVTACHTLLALERAGLGGARLYVGSWSEWCRRPDRPRAP